jgi:predicted nucleic acid-binding protein
VKQPRRFVIDAAIAVKFLFDEPGSPEARALQNDRLIAPDLLLVECANAIWKRVKRRELSAEEAAIKTAVLAQATIEFIPARDHLPAAVALAVRLDHAVYDCLYLAIAQTLAAPLVTVDKNFLNKAHLFSDLRDAIIPLSAFENEAAP